MLFQKEKLDLEFQFWPISIIVFRGILLMSYAWKIVAFSPFIFLKVLPWCLLQYVAKRQPLKTFDISKFICLSFLCCRVLIAANATSKVTSKGSTFNIFHFGLTEQKRLSQGNTFQALLYSKQVCNSQRIQPYLCTKKSEETTGENAS